MEENNSAELEEGEACYYSDDEDDKDNNIDPDIDLSYIDEKIQNVLGHFQKDFEGGVTAENLGAKFGGYGSFLPAYERSPSIWSRQRTPPKSTSAAKSPNHISMESSVQHSKVHANTSPLGRVGTASHSSQPLHNGKASQDDSVRPESRPCATSVSISSMKDENSNRSGNCSNKRTLKVRIKVGGDHNAQKNAAIYSGLGLDDSPSTSSGSSSGESEGLSPSFGEITKLSPASIIEVMTSFPVPDVALVSPLHENLLSLIKTETFFGDGRVTQHGMGKDVLDTAQVDAEVSRQTKIMINNQNEMMVEQRCEEGIGVDARMTSSMKKKQKSGKQSFSGNKRTGFSYAAGDVGRTTHKVSESILFPDEDRVKSNKALSDSLKDSSLKSITSQETRAEMQNRGNSLAERSGEDGVVKSRHAVCFDANANCQLKGERVVPSKASPYLDEHKEEFGLGAAECAREDIVQDTSFHAPTGTNTESEKEKPPMAVKKKKKSKGLESNGKAVDFSLTERKGVTFDVEIRDKKGSRYGPSPSKKKKNKSKPEKHIIKLAGDQRGLLQRSSMERTEKQMDGLGIHTSERQKGTDFNSVSIEHNGLLDKSKDRSSERRTTDISVFGASAKDVTGFPGMENGQCAEMVPSVGAHVLIEDNWVCCDLCQKWRLLPYGRKPDELPEKWVCSMLDWLPEMNRCDIGEDETTKALHAQNQVSVPESLNHFNVFASGVMSTNNQYLVNDHQNLRSPAVDSHVKSKKGLKELTRPGTSIAQVQLPNSKKNSLTEPVKGRSLNDMKEPLSESTLKRCKLSQSSKLNTNVEKHIPKVKEKNADGGVSKLIKVKGKRMSDQFESGVSKRAKPDETFNGTECENTDVELGRVNLSSKMPSTMKMQKSKHSRLFSPKEAKLDGRNRILVHVKNNRDQCQISAESASMDSRGEGTNSSGKRTFKNSLDYENGEQMHLPSAQDLKVFPKEEIGAQIFRKEKKPRIEHTAQKVSSSNKSKLESKVMQDLFGSDFTDCTEDLSIDKDSKWRKHRKKLVSQHDLDVDLMRGNAGLEQVSVAATSSSSKVSGAHKRRVNNEEVKGSPVESVSSSPLRLSNSVKFTSAGSDGMGKVVVANGGLPVKGTVKKSGEEKASCRNKIPLKMKKEKTPGGPNLVVHSSGTMDYRGIDANCKARDESKPSSGHLDRKSDCSQVGGFPADRHGPNLCTDENKVHKKFTGSTSIHQKHGTSSALRSNEIDKDSASDFDKEKVRAVDFSLKESAHKIKEQKLDSLVNPDGVSTSCEIMSNVKHTSADKHKKNQVSKKESLGTLSNANTGDDLPSQNKRNLSGGKLSTLCGTIAVAPTLPNLILDSKVGNKADSLHLGTRSANTISLLHRGDEGKQGKSTQDSSAAGTQIDVSNEFRGHSSPLDAFSKSSGPGKNCGAPQTSGSLIPEQHELKDVASSPSRANISVQTASTVLEEAKALRDYADRLKSSGFGFESNEACFQAAAKFLQGASLLETRNSDSGKHGAMTPLQVYSATAKLCESCAHEFEKSREMGAASLAYKCMEVAYLRVVCCKYSSLNRDRHDLQATLQMVPQGESPSSSASDVDNVNNQATIDKTNILKGTASHAIGNNILVARNLPTIARLLDFTQDVNCAMEASAKSQAALAAAVANMEGTQYAEQVTAVKRVIDFSFQDIDGLLRLVQLAREAISRSGFSGTRD